VQQIIKAAIVSNDPISSAVLSRLIKEWPSARVRCKTFPSMQAALGTDWIDESDVVFVSELPDDENLSEAVLALRRRASSPVCYVVSPDRGQTALAEALRAGARDYINRYVVDEDDVHRCLWGVLRAQNLALRHAAAAQMAMS